MLKYVLPVRDTLKWVFLTESIRWISCKVHVKPVYFDTVDVSIFRLGKPTCRWQVTTQLSPLWPQRRKPMVKQNHLWIWYTTLETNGGWSWREQRCSNRMKIVCKADMVTILIWPCPDHWNLLSMPWISGSLLHHCQCWKLLPQLKWTSSQAWTQKRPKKLQWATGWGNKRARASPWSYQKRLVFLARPSLQTEAEAYFVRTIYLMEKRVLQEDDPSPCSDWK